MVTFVPDGDGAMLRTLDDSHDVACRIYGIDAPEVGNDRVEPPKPGQPFGEESKRSLQQMIENKEVTVRIVEPPSDSNYHRAICQIEIEGKDVSAAQIQAGAAWVYQRYVRNPSDRVNFQRSMDDARRNGRGLWSEPNPEFPAQFRRRNQ